MKHKIQNPPVEKMKIVLIQDQHKKIINETISPLKRMVGVVSLEKIKSGGEFTIRILNVNQIRYRYEPATQKFEVHFLSLKKEDRKREGKFNDRIKTYR